MEDYAAMYSKLFNAMTDVIRILQQAQQETEKMYIRADEPPVTVLPKIITDNRDKKTLQKIQLGDNLVPKIIDRFGKDYCETISFYRYAGFG